MQVIVDPDFLDLLTNNGEVKSKHEGEYDPFMGKRVQTISMNVVKKLFSLPKEERKKMLLGLSNNSSCELIIFDESNIICEKNRVLNSSKVQHPILRDIYI